MACSGDGTSDGPGADGLDGSGGAGWGDPGAGGLGVPGAGGTWMGNGGGALPPPPVTCGNGTIEAPEACDGANLNGQTCASATMNALPDGALSCSTSCTLNTSACGATGGGGAPGTGGATGTGGMNGLGGTTSAGGNPGLGGAPTPIGGCGQSLPATSDYGAEGPFGSTIVNSTGPGGAFTIYRPATLGQNGFKHPVATWGNGITTTPAAYTILLGTVASHGFVVIASNSTTVNATLMTQGLDWMVQQNGVAGDFQNNLDPSCLITFGYSLGGGAAVTAGSRPNVKATVSLFGVQGSSGSLHDPLLLLTSVTDTFVTPAGFVTPTYNASSVQTFYGTLSAAGDPANAGHLIPINSAGPARAPTIAWLRLWAYGDPDARRFFYGNDCVLCTAPWQNPQRKNWPQ